MAVERPYESIREIALANGDVYEVGWNAAGVPCTEVLRILRWKRHGNIQIDVRLPGGSVCTRLFPANEVAQAFGSDDPDLHEW